MLQSLLRPTHLLLLVIAALVIFGPAKLPELGRSFGTMLKEFKKGASGAYVEEDKGPEVAPVEDKKQ